MINNKKLDSEK
ncbi:hypothetical protein PBNK65NY_000052100 [Plasmodium berghei]|uniref:Uncharacterized protein n=1 Tax=Plasmodium berghei TaxID=5821 RepID=A0A1C6WR69_PLABE|nr:hypothetical protein PBNK65NY_000052100 [Plasmodium berghei]